MERSSSLLQLEIIAAWPILLAGLRNTLLLCLVVAARACGGLILALLSRRSRRWCAGR